MKTLKMFCMASLMALAFSSCVPDEGGQPVTYGPDLTDLVLNGTFQAACSEEIISTYENNYVVETQMQGEGDLNELGKGTVFMRHCKSIHESQSTIDNSIGDFILTDESRASLFGTYSAYEFSNQVNSTFAIKITGGTGKYKNTLGNVTIFVQPHSEGIFTVGVKGELFYKYHSIY